MNQALISVVVPVYNVEKHVEKCVMSIINQTYLNLEIILVDDGSTDNSYIICESLAKRDSRISVIHKEHAGLASARNKGLEYVHGEYVGFVDSDDWIESDTYEMMYYAASAHPNYIITSGRYNVNEITNEKTPQFELTTEQIWSRTDAIRCFLTWNNMDASVCDKLFPVKLISGLSFPNGLVSEDVVFTYQSLERCDGVIHIGQCKYNYLQRDGSLTHSDFSDKSKGRIVYPKTVWEHVYKNYPELKEEADYYCFLHAIYYIKSLYLNGGKEKEEAKSIRKNIFAIMQNDFFAMRQKIMAFLIAFHLFGLSLKLYCKFSRGV